MLAWRTDAAGIGPASWPRRGDLLVGGLQHVGRAGQVADRCGLVSGGRRSHQDPHRGHGPRGTGVISAYGLAAVAGCQLCYFNAVQHLSVGVALMLEYLAIVLVVGWMWMRHGHRPGRLTTYGSA